MDRRVTWLVMGIALMFGAAGYVRLGARTQKLQKKLNLLQVRTPVEKRLETHPSDPKGERKETARLGRLEEEVQSLKRVMAQLKSVQGDSAPRLTNPPARQVVEEVPFDDHRARERSAQELKRGADFFREARYSDAANAFSHAIFYDAFNTRGFLGLFLEAFVRGHWLDAAAYLSRAMRSSKSWLETAAPPQAFFKSQEEYLRYLFALEEHLKASPLDVDAKLVLAYNYYFTKSPQYAKSVLVEIRNIAPAHTEAAEFLTHLP